MVVELDSSRKDDCLPPFRFGRECRGVAELAGVTRRFLEEGAVTASKDTGESCTRKCVLLREQELARISSSSLFLRENLEH